MSDNLPEFRRKIERAIAAAPRLHQEAVQRMAEAGVTFNVENSPVKNGYYRAGHTLGIGLDRPSSFIFEHPERVGASGPYPNRIDPIPAPDLGSIAAAVREIPFGQSVVFYNDVRHAGFVEEGTAAMPPRFIYQRAESAVQLMANEEARRIEEALSREVA